MNSSVDTSSVIPQRNPALMGALASSPAPAVQKLSAAGLPAVGGDHFAAAPKPGALQGQASQALSAATGLPVNRLQRGDHSTAVHQLQNALVKLKVMTPAQLATGPGWFGGRTEAAVMRFQTAHHLKATGVYDASTRTAMTVALGHPAPAKPPVVVKPPAAVSANTVPKGEAAQYQFFKKFIAAHGGKFLTGPNRMNLVGLRKDDRAGRGDGQYNDVMYAVYTDAAGRPHATRFTYTSEPTQNMRYFSGDANGDGSKDQGRIPAGFHTFEVSQRSNGAPCLRPTSSFTPERDINHDLRFNENYHQGDGSPFLFHQGGNYGTGSAGCQTLPPGEWKRFWNLVRNAHGDLGYTLTTSIPKNA
jgi:hypothetical protein